MKKGYSLVFLLVTACNPLGAEQTIDSLHRPGSSGGSCSLPTLSAEATASQLLAGTELIGSSQAVVQGTMPNRGALNAAIAFPGEGYYSGTVSNSPVTTQIVTGQTILGVAGAGNVAHVTVTGLLSDVGAAFESIADEHSWGTCSNVAYTTRQTCDGAGHDWTPSDPPAGYREIPSTASDTGNVGIVAATRPGTTCGTSGTIQARIADCAADNPATSTWNGSGTYPRFAAWRLVSRTAASREVWRDERTLLLWATPIPSGAAGGTNWCRMSGNAELHASGLDCRANSGTSCAGVACQPATPVSTCAEATGLAPNVTGEDWGAGTYSSYKGYMGKNSLSVTGAAVRWRLASAADFIIAMQNGMLYVVPDIGQELRFSTLLSGGNAYRSFYSVTTNQWFGSGIQSDSAANARNSAGLCVGR